MICPVCKKDGVVVEFNRIELDYCPNCGGVWFDAGELELLLEAAGITDYKSYAAQSKEAVTKEKKRKCPVCRDKMKKSFIDEDVKVMVDICRHGHGIWFDGGEVAQLIKELEAKKPGQYNKEVLAFVGDMFKYTPQKK